MFLTRVLINPGRREARSFLGSTHAQHAEVLGGLPLSGHGTQERMLWRLESTGRHQHAPQLLVLSPQRPDYTGLVERVGWADHIKDAYLTKDYAPVLDSLQKDQMWGFRLVASPMFTARNLGGKRTVKDGRGLKLAHVTVEHQTRWLLEKAQSHGFAIPSGPHGPRVQVVGRETENFRKVAEDRRVTVRSATFDGFLQVKDPQQLREAIRHGVGPSKAWGCGMLTLARIKQG